MINFILENKINITNFIRQLDKEIFNNNNNVGKLIRKIIHEICLLKKYNYLENAKLLGFLHRTHKYIKFTGIH